MSQARANFLATLRTGLRGAPSQYIEELVSDYSAHFDEGARNGRSEDDIAAALGDPLLLVDELRTEANLASWQHSPTPRSGLRLVADLAKRGAVNGLLVYLVLPLVCMAAATLACASLAALISGIWFLFAGSSFELNGGIATVLLASAGLIFAGITLLATTLLAGTCLVNTFVRFARRRDDPILKSGAMS